MGVPTPPVGIERERRTGAAGTDVLWVAAAAALGFTTTALFSSLLQFPRDGFVAVYALVVGLFLERYLRWSGLDTGQFLRRRWPLGVIGAVVVGALMVASVQRMAGSPRPAGWPLLWDLLWLGVVYGIVDALLLTVLPVVAIWRAGARRQWTSHWAGRVAVGAAAFAASLVVTAAYHLGYAEFRGPQVIDALIGNGLMTLGYLVTGSPIAAIGAHVALHIASVLHGVETTVTLPPHD